MIYRYKYTGKMKEILFGEESVTFVFFDSLVGREGQSIVIIYGKRLVERFFIDTTSRYEYYNLYERTLTNSFTHLEFPSDIPETLKDVFEIAKNRIEEQWEGVD